jgi:hypothetical protein
MTPEQKKEMQETFGIDDVPTLKGFLLLKEADSRFLTVDDMKVAKSLMGKASKEAQDLYWPSILEGITVAMSFNRDQ